MAEDGAEGETAAPGAGEGVNAAAIAAALDIAADRPDLDTHLAAFFDAQAALTRAQAHHLHVQLPRARLGTIADAFKVALQGAVVLALLIVLVQIGLIIADARNDYGLEIQAIAVPQWLGQRGYSGTAVAEALQGRLETIRATANGNSAMNSSEVRGGRQETLKVEIPETGLSFEQVERFLHDSFGHSRTLSGAIVDSGNGHLAMHIAVSGSEPITVEGTADDMPGLLLRGAEAAFEAFDPYNTVIYLAATGRREAALARAEANIAGARTAHDLADTLGLAGNVDPDPRITLAKGLAAVEIDRGFWGGWHDIALGSIRLGHDEAALNAYREDMMIVREVQPRQMQSYVPVLVWQARFEADKLSGDFPAALRDLDAVPFGTKAGGLAVATRGKVDVLSRLHDCAGAEAALSLAGIMHAADPGELTQDRRLIARCRGDWATAIAISRQVAEQPAATARPDDNVTTAMFRQRARLMLAEDLLDAGRADEAATTLGATPADCYPCNRLHGRIDAASADPRNADARFAAATRQAPSIPFAYVEWATARLARHDTAGALALVNTALARSPDNPDAAALKGDIELALGNPAAALIEYRQAAHLAPAWQRMRETVARIARTAG